MQREREIVRISPSLLSNIPEDAWSRRERFCPEPTPQNFPWAIFRAEDHMKANKMRQLGGKKNEIAALRLP
jgi:hypothetical protein